MQRSEAFEFRLDKVIGFLNLICSYVTFELSNHFPKLAKPKERQKCPSGREMSINRIVSFGYPALILGLVCLALFQCNQEKSGSEQAKQGADLRFKNLHDTVDYVGMKQCKTCHSNVYESFKKTGMGQSFGKAKPGISDADFKGHPKVYDSFKDLYYTPFWRDSTLFIKEYRLENGDTVHKRVQEIDYVIGSGHHTNSHIYSANGYLYQAPLTFYTQKGKWDLPPGFGKGNNTRFTRKIGAECMTCHNMYPEFEELSVNKYHKVPNGIACERCHGPGELHVKAKKQGEIIDTAKQADRTIVNPSKLPTNLKNDVCQRCHLQGNAVLKEGKSFFDFKPGMELSSVMTVFRPQFKEKGAFIMASHSERLQQSECYKATRENKSFEALNCITCHNPHKSVKVTEDQYFNNTCQECHNKKSKKQEKVVECKAPQQRRAKVDNNCVKCHMPKSGSADIPHVSINDHKIRVRDSQAGKKLAQPSMQELTVKKLKSYNNPSPGKKTKARAYLYYFEKFRNKPRFLDSAKYYLDRLAPSENQAEWIQYFFLRQDYEELIRFVNRLDSIRIKEAKPHYQIGQAYFDQKQWNKALEYFEAAVNKKPYNLDYRNKLASVYIRRRQLSKAQDQLDFIMKENPQLAFAHNNQGFLYLVKQKFAKAKKSLDKAISLSPDYGKAHLNLGKYYLGKSQWEKANQKLQNVRKRYPKLAKEANRILKMIERRQS